MHDLLGMALSFFSLPAHNSIIIIHRGIFSVAELSMILVIFSTCGIDYMLIGCVTIQVCIHCMHDLQCSDSQCWLVYIITNTHIV